MSPPGKRFAEVQGIRVDIDALRALAHQCRPERCDHAASCCSTYEVQVDRREMGTIIGAMPDAARHARGLMESGGPIDPFEDTEGGQCLATDEDGLCVFSFRNAQGHPLCSLHAAALDHGLHPYRVKPLACAIWPLFFVEDDPPLLTVQDGATKFPCNTTRRSAKTPLHAGVAQIIRDVWGEEFLGGVVAAME